MRAYLSAALFMLTYCSFAQMGDSSVHIASPNATALAKVTDIPVSFHTGVPNIDIPIYTVHEGPLTMPVSLSYHASGIKVMEQSSWVGAGWSLNAGGVITRAVRGLPDEKMSSPLGSYGGQ